MPKIKLYLILEIMTAAVIGGYQYFNKGLDSAILSGLTVLIAFSPFCLALTTPIALHLAKKIVEMLGIKVNSKEALITLSQVDNVAISMNNIITNGNYYVTDLVPEGLSQNSLLSFAAAACRDSNHALAQKIYETAVHRRLDVQSVPNCGVEALMNNTPVRFGRPNWIESEKIEISAELFTKVDQLAARGKTPLMLAMGRMARGIIALKDEIDMDSVEFLDKLKQNDFEIIMLSADAKKTVNSIAKNIKIENFRAALAPEDKAREVQLIRARKKFVAMIGKDVSDLPALISADVSILLQDGSLTLNDSEVQMNFEINQLTQFMDLRKIANHVSSIIKQNRWLAYFSWLLLLPPALMMALDNPPIAFNPIIAAVGVFLFAILIVANSFRVKSIVAKS